MVSRAPFQVLVIPWRRRDALEVAVFRRADYDLWEFVSGGGEDDETPELAATREGFEEAAIPAVARYLKLDTQSSVPACWFPAWSDWPEHVLVVPEYAFAVEVEDVHLRSSEHRELRWCSIPEAMKLLRFDSNRTALWELHERLAPGPRVKRLAFQ